MNSVLSSVPTKPGQYIFSQGYFIPTVYTVQLRNKRTSHTRTIRKLYAYAYSVIRACPAFVIHCHTFALSGVVLHNKRNDKVKATTRSTKFE